MFPSHPIDTVYQDYTQNFHEAGFFKYDFETTPGARENNIVYDDTNVDNVSYIALGEAPGKDEVLAGLPFKGTAGQNLRSNIPQDKLNQTWITNVVKHRPVDVSEYGNVKNRAPEDAAIHFSVPYLYNELSIVGFDKPILVVWKTGLKGICALIAHYNPDVASQTKKLASAKMEVIVNKWYSADFPFPNGEMRKIHLYLIYHTSPFNYSGDRESKKTAAIQDGMAEFYGNA